MKPLPRPEPGDAVGVCLHGATLNLEADRPELLSYARLHLAHLAGPPAAAPDLVVRCSWSEGRWDREANPFVSSAKLEPLGKRMLGNESELVWLDTLRMPGLKLRFRREGSCFRFDVHYGYTPKVAKRGPVPHYEYKRYFSLMSYLVYYPLLWFLRRTRGLEPLHASALDADAGGVLIGGLGGVGKTTTCVALMGRPDVRLLSENLALTDGTFVYACYEPIRLDDGSLSLLEGSMARLAPMPFPEGLKKKRLFHARATADRTVPAVLFLPRLSDRPLVEPIDPVEAAERLAAMNRLTRELDDFGWYAAALDLQWPSPAGGVRGARLLELTRRTRCYALSIDRGQGIAPLVDRLIRWAGGGGLVPAGEGMSRAGEA